MRFLSVSALFGSSRRSVLSSIRIFCTQLNPLPFHLTQSLRSLGLIIVPVKESNFFELNQNYVSLVNLFKGGVSS